MKLTSREFNRGIADAKRRASEGPVFITERGKPAFVLLTIEEYRRLAQMKQTIVDLLAAYAEEATVNFDPPRFRVTPRDVDLS